MTEQDRVGAFIAQENAAKHAKRAMNPTGQWTHPRAVQRYNQERAAIWYARARRIMGIETGEHDHDDDC